MMYKEQLKQELFKHLDQQIKSEIEQTDLTLPQLIFLWVINVDIDDEQRILPPLPDKIDIQPIKLDQQVNQLLQNLLPVRPIKHKFKKKLQTKFRMFVVNPKKNYESLRSFLLKLLEVSTSLLMTKALNKDVIESIMGEFNEHATSMGGEVQTKNS